VRGVTWSGLGNLDKQGIYKTLSTHFESLPEIDEEEVNSLEDLTPAVELYNTLIGLGRYDDAAELYNDRLADAMLYNLGSFRQCAEILEMLFPDGLDQLPRLSNLGAQSVVVNDLAISINNQPSHAAELYRRAIDLKENEDDQKGVNRTLGNLSVVLRYTGALRESEAAALLALRIAQHLNDQDEESANLCFLGIALAVRGEKVDSAKALSRSLELAIQGNVYIPYDYQVMRAVWFGEYAEAQALVVKALTFSQKLHQESAVIRAARLQGEAALGLSDLTIADERLHYALARARTVNLVEEELPALIGLAELRRRQGDLKVARELLDDLWEPADRGPFKLFHADAFNVLAQIERDAGNIEEATKAAMEAYRLAWCNGPPFAYHWGLQKARAHLAAFGVPEPILPPFDESKYEPMPEVEIEP